MDFSSLIGQVRLRWLSMGMLCENDSSYLRKVLDELASIVLASPHFGSCCESVGSMMLHGVCCVLCAVCAMLCIAVKILLFSRVEHR